MWKGGAEAVLNLHPNASISIAYDAAFDAHDDLLLLELDDSLLAQILQNRVSIRGEADEEAVLCTPSATYALKYVGTSNSVFLIPPSDPLSNFADDLETVKAASAIKLAPGVMELVEIAPRLGKLKGLLAENPYRAEEDSMEVEVEVEENKGLRLLRWEDLVERVQASDEELKGALKDISAVEINGYWRIVDGEYMDMVLNMVLHNLVLNGWSLDGFEEDQVLGIMGSDGFPLKIVLHCLEIYGRRVNAELSGGGCLWRLDEKRVCVHFARAILRGGKLKMERFMEEWMDKIPAGMSADFEFLEGEVLAEKIGVETWVWAFSVASLPAAPAERFASLFRERQKWEWKDLQPYIRDLRVPGLSSESLLLKYTRRTQPTMDAEPVFSAR